MRKYAIHSINLILYFEKKLFKLLHWNPVSNTAALSSYYSNITNRLHFLLLSSAIDSKCSRWYLWPQMMAQSPTPYPLGTSELADQCPQTSITTTRKWFGRVIFHRKVQGVLGKCGWPGRKANSNPRYRKQWDGKCDFPVVHKGG